MGLMGLMDRMEQRGQPEQQVRRGLRVRQVQPERRGLKERQDRRVQPEPQAQMAQMGLTVQTGLMVRRQRSP